MRSEIRLMYSWKQMTFDSERQLVNSNGDLRNSRSTKIAVPIRMWKFSRKRLAMLVGFMRSADMRSLAQHTYTYTIIRFFLTSVYAHLMPILTAHPRADLHDGCTDIFDGGRVIALSRRKISLWFISWSWIWWIHSFTI